MKAYAGALLTILGIVGILLSAVGQLPPEYDTPLVTTVVAIIGMLIAGLGWQDELEAGKIGLIDLVRKFFEEDQGRKFVLTSVILVIREGLDVFPDMPNGLEIGLNAFLAIAAVFSYSASYSSYKATLHAKIAAVKYFESVRESSKRS